MSTTHYPAECLCGQSLFVDYLTFFNLPRPTAATATATATTTTATA